MTDRNIPDVLIVEVFITIKLFLAYHLFFRYVLGYFSSFKQPFNSS